MEGGFWPAGWLSYPVGEAVGVLFFFLLEWLKFGLESGMKRLLEMFLLHNYFLFACMHECSTGQVTSSYMCF